MSLSSSLKLTCIASILYYLYRKSKSYSFFKRYGYSGPEPRINDLGNMRQFYDKNKKTVSYSKTLFKWSKKYGKIYGYYQGFTPILVISDVNLVQDVFVSTDKLHQHRRTFATSKQSDDEDADVFTNNGERWSRVRVQLEKSILNKQNIAKCIHHFEKSFKTTFLSDTQTLSATDTNIYDKIKQLMANAMFQVMFGMRLDEHYYKCGLDLMYDKLQISSLSTNKCVEKYLIKYLVQKFDLAFQEFQSNDPLIKLFAIFFSEFGTIWRFCKKVKSRIVYFLQIDSSSGDPMFWFSENFVNKQFELYHTGHSSQEFNFFQSFLTLTTKQQNLFKLSTQEALSNSLLMFFAGYETTANAIAFASFIISSNALERDRLIHEIDSCVSLEYESIEKLKYLDMFIKEVLRMFPVANSMVSRKNVQENFYVGESKEYYVPSGLNIVVDVLSIHFNQELWGPVDVYRFHPERFLDKRHQCAWLPFGVGRRKCMGMRLALSQIKLFIISLLRNYQISSCLDTNAVNPNDLFHSIETKEVLFNVPVDGIRVNLKKIIK